MRTLALAVLLALGLPSAARSAACSPLNCAPSQFTFAHGTMAGYRTSAHGPVTVVDLRTGRAVHALPEGITAGRVLVHRAGRTIEWYDMRRGTRVATAPLVRPERLVGVSQDGSRAVTLRLAPGGGTELTIVSRHARRALAIPGRDWDFDALAGDNLFLIKYLPAGGYQVRLLHLSTGRLEAAPLKDPHESGTIWGQPFSRLASPDGRYLFTLYISGNGAAMVHELDVHRATARCIDLPGTGDYGSAATWALELRGRTLWAASPGYGRVVAIDVLRRTVTRTFRIDLPYWNVANGTRAALSPDGTRLALANQEQVAVFGVADGRLVRRDRSGAVAVAYSPAGRLWTLF